MIDIMICGINGRMGKKVYSAAENTEGVNVACGVDRLRLGDFRCPVYACPTDAEVHVDVIIDFSSPELAHSICEFAESMGCAVLFATTGYTGQQIQMIKRLSEKTPVCLASNTSEGIGGILGVLPELRRALAGFDAAIVETHRKGKRDKPSGTALTLAEALGGAEIFSVRGGDIAGMHEIKFMSQFEEVTIKHTAFSRDAFAAGALKIAKALCSLPAGLYGRDL